MKRIAFATCHEFAALTRDDLLCARELERRGVLVSPLIWDEDDVDGYDAVILRSCWDYHLKTNAFVSWLESLEKRGVPVLNPPQTCLWNLNKDYLDEMATWGFTIPRTLWLAPGSKVDLAEFLVSSSLREAVIKPAVSMTGYDTWRATPETARQHQGALDQLLRTRRIMAQEFIPEILTEGELSLVFFEGVYSHAVRKRAQEGEFRIHEEYGGKRTSLAAPPMIVRECQRLLARIGPTLLYARIDGIPVGNRFVIMEAELIDPSLFLATAEGADVRFAEAILKRL